MGANTTTPKVSVLVPIYNMRAFLAECLDSLVAQTLDDIEVICIDDGSTDDSPAIIDRYVADHANFRAIRKENSGYGDSMNRGLAEAKGDYIGIVEPDDRVAPTLFAHLYDAATADDVRVDIAKTSYWRIVHAGTDDELLVPCFYQYEITPPRQPFTIADEPTFLFHHPSIWSAVYRADFLREASIDFVAAPGAGWVDNPFFIETMLSAASIRYIDEPLYYYREFDDGSLCHLSDWHVLVDRFVEMDDIVRAHGVTDPGVLEGHYNRGCAHIMFLRGDFGRFDRGVREAQRTIARRIDYDAVMASTRILPEYKRALAAVGAAAHGGPAVDVDHGRGV